ncbi:MAG: glycosyltransferase [Thermoanaerobaculia bacterium]
MRILRIVTRLNAGGPARHVVWAESGLAARGHVSLLLAGRVGDGEDDLGRFAAEEGVPVRLLARMAREIEPGEDLATVRDVARILREFRPDVVHTHTAKAGFIGRAAAALENARRLGRDRIRVVHTFHGNVLSGYFPRPKESLFRGIERLLGRCATDAVLVLSPQQRAEIVERFRVAPPERVFTVPLAVDLSAFEPGPSRGALRAELGLGADHLLVGAVGRVAPVKDHPLFLRAAAAVARELPSARFVVVGGGESAEAARGRASELGIASKVFFLGMRTDLPAIYADLDLVALTSRNEGTPLSLVEAMAAGRPVVAADVGGVRDLLTSEWEGGVRERRFRLSTEPRGILVGDRTPEAFAREVVRALRSPGLREALGGAGRAHARRAHGLDRLLDDLEEVYSLAGPSGPSARPGARRTAAVSPP